MLYFTVRTRGFPRERREARRKRESFLRFYIQFLFFRSGFSLFFFSFSILLLILNLCIYFLCVCGCYRADPFAKKDWYDIKAPSVFTVKNVGKTLVTRTQGTKVSCFFFYLFVGYYYYYYY